MALDPGIALRSPCSAQAPGCPSMATRATHASHPARPSAALDKKRGFCPKRRHLRRRGTSLCLESQSGVRVRERPHAVGMKARRKLVRCRRPS